MDKLLTLYDIDPSEVSPLRGGLENEKFLISLKSGHRLLLKVYRDAPQEEVQCEIEVLLHLRSRGIPAQVPVPNREGRDVHSVNGRWAAMFEFIEGCEPGATPETFRTIGRLLARIHNCESIDCMKSGYSIQRDAIEAFMDAEQTGSDFRSFLQECLAATRGLYGEHLERRMCHCDLFLDNIIRGWDGQLLPIDFEEVAVELVVFDIGRAIIGGGQISGGHAAVEYCDALLVGYQEIRKLDARDLALVHEGIVYAGMISTFWRYRAFEIEKIDEQRIGSYKTLQRVTQEYLDAARSMGLLEHV